MLAYPTLREVLLFSLLAWPVAQFALAPVAGLMSPRLGIVVAEVSLVAMLAIFIKRRRYRIEDLFLLNATRPIVLAATVPTAIGAALIVAECDLTIARFFAEMDLVLPLFLQRDLLEIQLITSLGDGLATGIAVVLAPGVCEELFFRGFVLTALLARGGSRKALLGSALVFALLHFSPTQLPAHFLIGLFLGLLVYWTHSIYPAILAHMTNNLLSVIGVNARTYTGSDALGVAESLPPEVLLIALVMLWSGIRVINRCQPIMPLIASETPGERSFPGM